jgi:hypothetical protein
MNWLVRAGNPLFRAQACFGDSSKKQQACASRVIKRIMGLILDPKVRRYIR